MWRERALKIVLVLVGLLFTAGVYPLIGSLLHPADSDTGDTMMLSLYVALGGFLLAVTTRLFHRDIPPRTMLQFGSLILFVLVTFWVSRRLAQHAIPHSPATSPIREFF